MDGLSAVWQLLAHEAATAGFVVVVVAAVAVVTAVIVVVNLPYVIASLSFAGTSHQADVDAPDRLGQTPCHHAALTNQPGAILALHAARADLERRNTACKTPLMTAGINHNEAAKLVIIQALGVL